MLVNNFLHDAQADARAFGRVSVTQSLEQQENLLVIFRRNAGAVILHPELVADAGVATRYFQVAGAALVVLHGIAEQVGEYLSQSQPVGH